MRQISGRSGGGWLLLLVSATLLWTFGVGLAFACARDGLPHGVIFGLFVAGVISVGAAGSMLEYRNACNRPGATVGTTPDGRPATVIARSGAVLPLAVLGLVVMAAAPLASGVVAIADGQSAALAVILIPLGLWPASYLVPVLRGQVHAGGLYLTPDGITHIRYGSWWRMAWPDVLGAVAGQPVAVAPYSGRPERGRTSRWGWGETRGPAQIGAVDTRQLAADPSAITLLISQCVLHPELRRELGTPESLMWPVLRMSHARRFSLRRTGHR